MFIVYQLVDPRDGKPFYIGSGKLGRPYEHFVAAANNKPAAHLERIREIMSQGIAPAVETLLMVDGRLSAYEHERVLIASTPGLLNTKGRRVLAINFLDEFCTAILMPPEHKLKRLCRLLKSFNPNELAKRPGYLRLWFAAWQYCYDQICGKPVHS